MANTPTDKTPDKQTAPAESKPSEPTKTVPGADLTKKGGIKPS
ncbi:hypothetical protein [Luteibacter yeojuensis]|nr:hypothetical protein [Luteibacter yeojuensis]